MAWPQATSLLLSILFLGGQESQLRASAGHGKLDHKAWLYSHLLSGLGKLLALTRLGFLIC